MCKSMGSGKGVADMSAREKMWAWITVGVCVVLGIAITQLM